MDNTAYIYAYLVAPDNFGYPVQICWRYSAHSKHDTYLKEVSEKNAKCNLEVWWEKLPVEELHKYQT